MHPNATHQTTTQGPRTETRFETHERPGSDPHGVSPGGVNKHIQWIEVKVLFLYGVPRIYIERSGYFNGVREGVRSQPMSGSCDLDHYIHVLASWGVHNPSTTMSHMIAAAVAESGPVPSVEADA